MLRVLDLVQGRGCVRIEVVGDDVLGISRSVLLRLRVSVICGTDEESCASGVLTGRLIPNFRSDPGLDKEEPDDDSLSTSVSIEAAFVRSSAKGLGLGGPLYLRKEGVFVGSILCY